LINKLYITFVFSTLPAEMHILNLLPQIILVLNRKN
jgi:hypothetical protein